MKYTPAFSQDEIALVFFKRWGGRWPILHVVAAILAGALYFTFVHFSEPMITQLNLARKPAPCTYDHLRSINGSRITWRLPFNISGSSSAPSAYDVVYVPVCQLDAYADAASARRSLHGKHLVLVGDSLNFVNFLENGVWDGP